MTVTKQLRGTSELHFRIGLAGPTVYQGSASPTVTPPTPIDTLKDGDLYLRTGTGNEGIWIRESGTFNRFPSPVNGGTYTGPMIFDGNLTANGSATTIGNASGDQMTVNARATFPNATTVGNSLLIGGDAVLYRNALNTLRTDGDFRVGANQTVGGNITVTGTLIATTNPAIFSLGSAASPALTFVGDTNTGIYRVSADEIGIAGGGVLSASFSATQISAVQPIRGTAGVISVPAFSFLTDTDSGMNQLSTGTVDLVTDSVAALRSTRTITTRFATSAAPTLRVQRTDGGNGVDIGHLDFSAPDAAANVEIFGQIKTTSVDNTNTSEDGKMELSVMAAGSLTSMLSIEAGAVFPTTDNTISLGKVANRWNTVYGEATSAKYADLAERYFTAANTMPGMVMVIEDSNLIWPCTDAADERVLGVISEKPAFLMNDDADKQDWAKVALRGRVPVLCLGDVRPGDLLVTRSRTGYAQKATWFQKVFRPHAVFAKVLRRIDRKTVEAVIL
jgi:hypothetical protein